MALAPPPHPMAKFRILKHALRVYLRSGRACEVVVATPPNQPTTDPTVANGTVNSAQSVPQRPVQATVMLFSLGQQRAQGVAPVNRTTGAFTHTFVANTIPGPGTAFVRATAVFPGTTTPVHTGQSGNFLAT